MRKTTIKEVIQGNEWNIKRVIKGSSFHTRGRVRLDAQRRHHKPDAPDFFSEWTTLQYINRLRTEADKEPLQITHY